MRRTIQKIKIGIFMGILILPSVLWQGIRFLAPQSYEELNYDLGENREREQLPETLDLKDCTVHLEAYYNDHAPFRSTLISLEQRLSGALERVYDEHLQDRLARLIYGEGSDTVMDISNLLQGEDELSGEQPGGAAFGEHAYECTEEIAASCMEAGRRIYTCRDCKERYEEIIPATGHDSTVIAVQEPDYTAYGHTEYQCSVCGEIYYDDFVGKLIDNSYLAPKEVGGGTILGRFNWLFYSGNDSILYYTGENIMEEGEMQKYLDSMERLQELCDEKGIQLQFMVMPNKEQVYPEYMPSYEILDTYKRMDRFVDYVRGNSEIHIIYPLQELKEAELYWQTYYQYDTHWNDLGGYIGTQALYEALGLPVTSPLDLEITPRVSEVNGLFAIGGLDEAAYPPGLDYFVDYKPDIKAKNIVGSKVEYVHFATCDSGRKQNFVLLGDSFRSFMSDYLVKDFANTAILHRDYIEGLEEDIRNADILVISSVERYDTYMFDLVEKVIKILEEEGQPAAE